MNGPLMNGPPHSTMSHPDHYVPRGEGWGVGEHVCTAGKAFSTCRIRVIKPSKLTSVTKKIPNNDGIIPNGSVPRLSSGSSGSSRRTNIN